MPAALPGRLRPPRAHDPDRQWTEFTDRFGDARWRTRERGTGAHPFDRLCASRGVVHKLTRPYRPQTNGMVERFNRRLAEAIAVPPDDRRPGKNRFNTPAERDDFLTAFVRDYNRTRLRCLSYQAPAEALANLTGHNTCAGMSGVGGDTARHGTDARLTLDVDGGA